MFHAGLISCAGLLEGGQLNLAKQHICNADGLDASARLVEPEIVTDPVVCSADYRARNQHCIDMGFKEKYVHQTGTNLEVCIMAVGRVMVRGLRWWQPDVSGSSS